MKKSLNCDMVLKRCVDIFLQALGSKKTHKNYLYHLDNFLAWNKLTDYDDLLKADDKAIQRNLEDYLIDLKGSKSANYIPSMIAPIELFYTMNVFHHHCICCNLVAFFYLTCLNFHKLYLSFWYKRNMKTASTVLFLVPSYGLLPRRQS